MPITFLLSGDLTALTDLISNAPVDAPIYLSKDENGTLQCNTYEQIGLTENTGYPFSFPDGTVIYTIPAITSLTSIPWTYSLSSPLNDYTHLTLWLDAMETKSINVTTQKWMSKMTNYLLIENTANYDFSYSSSTIDLTALGAFETLNNQAVKQYFKIGIVIQCPSQTLSNHTIFQHNRFSIRLSGTHTSPEGTATYMISTHDNGTFMKGITFKPSDATFKYFIYADNTGELFVSGNSSEITASPSFYQNTSTNIYIGQESDGTKNSQVKLHEILYYQSTANDLAMLYSDMSSYFTSRWSLSTYSDTFNVMPISWTNTYSIGDRQSLITITTDFTVLVGALSNLVKSDATYGNDANSMVLTGEAGTNKYIKFQLQTAKKIQGFKIIASHNTTAMSSPQFVFKFQGSNDNSNWTDLKTGINLMSTYNTYTNTQVINDVGITVNSSYYANTYEQHELVTNNVSYTYYRFFGTSGTVSTGTWQRIYFYCS